LSHDDTEKTKDRVLREPLGDHAKRAGYHGDHVDEEEEVGEAPREVPVSTGGNQRDSTRYLMGKGN
jgi:hypothetical protein